MLIPVGSAASLPGRPPRSRPLLLASNSSAWTNSWEGAGRAEPVNQSLTPRRGLARGGSGGPEPSLRGQEASTPGWEPSTRQRAGCVKVGPPGASRSPPPRSLRLPGLSSPHLVSPGRSGYCAAPERAETLTSRPGPRGLLSPGEPAVLGQAPRIRSGSSRHRLAKPNRSPSCRLVSLRRPPHGAHRGGSTQGVKSSGSPWLLAALRKR